MWLVAMGKLRCPVLRGVNIMGWWTGREYWGGKAVKKMDKREREDQKQLEEHARMPSWCNLTWRAGWKAAVTGLHWHSMEEG